MKIDAELRISIGSWADAVYKALIPDNVGTPSCMDINMSCEQGVISITVDSLCSIDTFIATLDDVLESCELSLKSLNYLSDHD